MSDYLYARIGEESVSFSSFLASLPFEVLRMDAVTSVDATVTIMGTVMGETKHYQYPRNRGQRLISTGDGKYDYILSGNNLSATEVLVSTKSIRSELPIFMVGWIELFTRLPQLLSNARSILLVLDENLMFLSEPTHYYRQHQYRMLRAIFEAFVAPECLLGDPVMRKL